MSEQWIPVVGYEGWYEVSDLGRVRRMRNTSNTHAGKILKVGKDKDGYHKVQLNKLGIRRTFSVHRFVASAFLGPCPEGKEVNHKDGVKENNLPENLEYVTHAENHIHATRTGLKARGERAGRSKLTENDVLEIRRQLGAKTQKRIAEEYGVSSPTISCISTGKSWGWLKESTG